MTTPPTPPQNENRALVPYAPRSWFDIQITALMIIFSARRGKARARRWLTIAFFLVLIVDIIIFALTSQHH